MDYIRGILVPFVCFYSSYEAINTLKARIERKKPPIILNYDHFRLTYYYFYELSPEFPAK